MHKPTFMSLISEFTAADARKIMSHWEETLNETYEATGSYPEAENTVRWGSLPPLGYWVSEDQADCVMRSIDVYLDHYMGRDRP